MFVSSIKILEYDKIDISEGIDIYKTNKSKECNICHYWYDYHPLYHSHQMDLN